ncbi:hypothetical protein BZA77DRAFT_298281 [Pyronema omphalodes]|nr:hypothetical protein BZA77DRAFT_298281 [Pyronema omphalodes]
MKVTAACASLCVSTLALQAYCVSCLEGAKRATPLLSELDGSFDTPDNSRAENLPTKDATAPAYAAAQEAGESWGTGHDGILGNPSLSTDSPPLLPYVVDLA